jgi:hypothetical protein
MQEYKIIKYNTIIPQMEEHTFIVLNDFNFDDVLILLSESYHNIRNNQLEPPYYRYFSKLTSLLNPLNFKIDNLIINVIFESNLYELNDYYEKDTLFGISIKNIRNKIKICQDLKFNSFNEYSLKFINYDPNSDNSNDDIIILKKSFCKYFTKLEVFDNISIQVIDKLIKDHFYEKECNKLINEDPDFYLKKEIELSQLKRDIKTLEDYIFLNKIVEVESFNNFKSNSQNNFNYLNNINEENQFSSKLRFYNKKKSHSIELSKEIIEKIYQDFKNQTFDLLLKYKNDLRIEKHNYLLLRESPKNHTSYIDLKNKLSNLEFKINYLTEILKFRIENYKNGVFINTEYNLFKGLYNFFSYQIKSTYRIDFLIIEVFGLAGIICKTATDENTYIPNKIKKYKNGAQLAAARQDELDSFKKKWVKF